jgi:acetyl esterase/lipase
MDSIARDDALLVSVFERPGLVSVSVEYRLSPETRPVPVEDCYAGLAWTAATAVESGMESSSHRGWRH